MSSQKPQAIFLMGPTASGKTDLAIQLTKELPCDIISVDSALIYKGMDIGTAKPTAEELKQAPHRLINIVDPWESYSVARFYNEALREMQAITDAGRIPLLVGGTMMYFRVLRDGIAEMPSADEQVRKVILDDAEKHGWPYVHAQLAEIDPDSAARIKPTDPQRLQRALEVYRVSGKTLTEYWAEQKRQMPHTTDEDSQTLTGKGNKDDYTNKNRGLSPIPYDIVNLAIAPGERSALHDRIARRFRIMVKEGFLEEVESLYKSGKLEAQMPSMRCVGYRQAWDYLDGALDHEEMIERGIIATRQLAKRQLTWLRSWPDLNWLDTGDEKKLEKALKIVKQSTF